MRRGESIECILQRCLARIAAGESIAACLRDYPEHADELAPLLETVAELRGWAPPTLSDAARRTARARAHAALAVRRSRPSRRWLRVWAGGMRLALGATLALLLLLGTLGISVAAAQSSLPGQPLYGLKRQSEELRLQLANDAEQQAELRLQFAGRRLDEALAEVSDCAGAADLMSDMAQEYDKAWLAIAQLDPAAQARLRDRFKEAVRAHRQALDAARQRATSACARAELDRAEHVNDGAAEHIATLTSTPTFIPTSTPMPTVTRTPTLRRPAVRRTPTPAPTASPTDTPTSAPTEMPTETPTAMPMARRSDSARPRRPPTLAPIDMPPAPAPTDAAPTDDTPATPAPSATPVDGYPAPVTPSATPTEAPTETPMPVDGYPAPVTPIEVPTPPETSVPPGGEPIVTPEPGATPDDGLEETPAPTDQPVDQPTTAPTAADGERRTPVPTIE
ncbi:MAG: DUF5667 domain-containing protein [Roseiflexaceae bacterium]